MPTIHPTAIVNPSAELADSVTIGAFTIVEADVRIGEGTTIGPHCFLDNGARIGKNCDISQGVVIATPPQDLKYAGEKTEMFLGDNCTIREYCTLNRATTHSKKTIVGSNCLFMAYVHVAHDCRVGDNVIIANATQLGGHVHVSDHAIIGGIVAVHQFVHIGAHVMVGGGIRVLKDAPPFALAGHTPAQFEGLNSIGLRRRGFTRETLDLLDLVYHTIYYSGRNVSQAVEYIKDNMPETPEIRNILNFIADSKRGLMKAAKIGKD